MYISKLSPGVTGFWLQTFIMVIVLVHYSMNMPSLQKAGQNGGGNRLDGWTLLNAASASNP